VGRPTCELEPRRFDVERRRGEQRTEFVMSHWAEIYLILFIVGFALLAISFLVGTLHLHLPHVHLGGADLHGDLGHPDAGHGHPDGNGSRISVLNFGTAAGFSSWFGAAGYVLTRYSSFPWWLTLGMSATAGVTVATLIFGFVTKVLLRHDRALAREDYEMQGVVGTITVPIRAGGTGEIVFSQGGVRRCAGARSADGSPMTKGTEVVVMRSERGLVYVRKWSDLAARIDRIAGRNTLSQLEGGEYGSSE
jgi:membrane protein implicated in regulation of membrane protease activity